MNRRILMIVVILLGVIAVLTPLWLPQLRRVVNWADPLQTPIAQPGLFDPPGGVSASRPLQVTVRDAETGLPLSDAEVQVAAQQGRTDQLGVYTFEVATDGTQSVQVVSSGYERWQGEVDPRQAGAKVLTLDVSMQPNSVQGQVTDGDSRPLPAARVRLGEQAVALDGEARFVLRRVKVGDTITVEHPGYAPKQVTLDGSSPLQLSLELTSIEASVRDVMTGEAVPDVSVCVGDSECQPTDESGKAMLKQPAPGTTVSARREGYATNQAVYQGEQDLVIELAPQELYGVIRDASTGQPITNTILFVNGQATSFAQDGRYHLPELTQVYSMFVKAPGYRLINIPMNAETSTAEYQVLGKCQDPFKYPCVDIRLPRFAARGIYINYGLLWNRPKLMSMIDMVDRSPELNAIVVDVKGDIGYLAFESTDPIIASGNAMETPRVPLPELLQICKKKQIYTIARMVIFKDTPLVKARPELATHHPNGAVFYDRERQGWTDPTLEAVWEYNLAITREIIRLGFDEVQYDYLRFPSDSTSLEVVRALVYSVPSTTESRTGAIQGFVKAAKALTDQTPAFLSLDIFGYSLVIIPPEHDMRIGQRLMDLAPYADYVCPMVYPSTFIPGNLGLSNPSESPYEVVSISMRTGRERTSALMRPWLQHYWYSRKEFAAQKRAAEEATDLGWCFWSASGNYDELFFVPPEGIAP